MTIPSQIAALIDKINQNLAQIELEATDGLNLSRIILEQFPNNARLIQFFASFSSAMVFVELQRRRITSIVENFPTTDAEIQEIGEDLSQELGRVIETKILINNLKQYLEELL